MIYQSHDVYAVLAQYGKVAVGILLAYTVLYCVSYSMLFRIVGLKWWKAFIPLYGQSCLFKRFKKDPWLVFLPFLPIIGVCYIFESWSLRARIARCIKVTLLLRIPFTLFPTLGNILYYLFWRWLNADIHKRCKLGIVEEQSNQTRGDSEVRGQSDT